MLTKFLILFAALSTMRDCGNGAGRAAVLGFDSQPSSPKAGDNVTLWVAYDLPSPPITGGTATYSFSLNGIPFTPTVNPLCDETACPKDTGFNNESSWSIFPSGLSGKIVSKIEWHDQNNALVWCVETSWRV
jgi:hypothetical protein